MSEEGERIVSISTEALKKVPSHIETAGKLFAVCFGLLYLTGFLVVTFHLGRYGIFSPTLVRSQYVIAGLFLFVPSAIAFSFIYAVFRKPEDRLGYLKETMANQSRARRIVWVLFDSFRLLFLCYTFLAGMALMFGLDLARVGWKTLIWSSVLIAIFGPILNSIVGIIAAVLFLPRENLNAKSYVLFALGMTFFTLMALGSIQYFAYRFYSLVPYEFGGGQPLPVVFVLKANEAKDVITQDASGKKSIPYGLLMETSDAYFVVSSEKDQRAIELKKDAVEAVVILNRK
jgi:hypothetical protein